MSYRTKVLPIVLMMMALFIFFFLSCKLEITSAAEVEVQERPSSTLQLKGRVIDKKTLEGISSATVIIDGSYELSTDDDGYYEISAQLIEGDDCEIWAYADNYGYGSCSAEINSDHGNTVVNTIKLLPLNPAVEMGVVGGTIEEKTLEVLTGDSVVSVLIPAGALDNDTTISVTPFEGVDVPGLPPFGNLNIATVHIAPIGMSLNESATIAFPLPLAASYLGDSIPLLYFNRKTYQWLQAGIFAIVDTVNNVATVEISTLNTYSLAVKGSYEEVAEDSTIVDDGNWKMQSSPIEQSWQATVEYPQGIPNESTFSARWLKNAVSQNTKLIGGRTSFFDLTYTYLNFSGYYFFKIKIIIIIIPEYLTINNVRIYNVVRKRNFRIMRKMVTGGFSY